MDLTLVQLIEKLAAGGFAAFLIAVLVAGKYDVWMWSHSHHSQMSDKDRQIEYERDEKEHWRRLALEGRSLTDRTVTLAERVVKQQQP